MGLPQSLPRFDADTYLAWEAGQADKSECFQGEIFAMVGVRREHATVALNIGAALREHLRKTPCLPFVSDMKLRVATVDAFFYPDVMVTCDARDRHADLFVEHPKLIVEVLSESTAAYDRGTKFASYRQITELQEFVLIDIPARLHDYAGEPACRFDSVQLTLSLDTVFEDVQAPDDPALAPA